MDKKLQINLIMDVKFIYYFRPVNKLSCHHFFLIKQNYTEREWAESGLTPHLNFCLKREEVIPDKSADGLTHKVACLSMCFSSASDWIYPGEGCTEHKVSPLRINIRRQAQKAATSTILQGFGADHYNREMNTAITTLTDVCSRLPLC